MRVHSCDFFALLLVSLAGCGGSPGGSPVGSPTDLPPLVLQPTDLCRDYTTLHLPTFEDAKLERAIRRELLISAQVDLTCGLLGTVTFLGAQSKRIVSLVGIQNLVDLEELDLDQNSISDISALSGLTSLRILSLGGNLISDISALSGLTSLTHLSLHGHSIKDISALSGLTSLTTIGLQFNVNLTDIQPLLDNTGLGPVIRFPSTVPP